MGAADWLLLGVVAVCAVFAWRTWRKSLRRGGCACGGCGGSCERCPSGCGKAKQQ